MNYKVHPAENAKNIFDRILKKLHREVIINPERNKLRKNIIARLPPASHGNSSHLQIHTLVCERDAEMAVCTCKVLNFLSGINFKYILHDDGTLSNERAEFIKQHVNAEIIFKTHADNKAAEELHEFPNILNYRSRQIMALKLIDVKLFSNAGRIAYVDSDILFFKNPVFFITQLTEQSQQKNYFNKDILNAYIDQPENIFQHTGMRPFERINAGLWVMNYCDIDFEKIENILEKEYIRQHGYKYLLDQTLISMLANNSAAGAGYFPAEYDVNFYKQPDKSVCKHYVGKIRHAYEMEGLRYLLKNGIA